MFGRFRNLLFLGAIGGAVAVPYVVTNGRGLDSVRQFFSGSGRPADPYVGAVEDPLGTAIAKAGAEVDALFPGQTAPIKEIAPPHQLADVFRFDITIDWIMTQWPTVSVVSTDLNSQGYRVPLVSGINEDDIAGSLTYHFGPDRKLQKITFDGVTGNADRLIREVAEQNGLSRAASKEPNVFLYERKWSGKTQSSLQIRPAELISKANASRRFQVSLMLVPQPTGWF